MTTLRGQGRDLTLPDPDDLATVDVVATIAVTTAARVDLHLVLLPHHRHLPLHPVIPGLVSLTHSLTIHYHNKHLPLLLGLEVDHTRDPIQDLRMLRYRELSNLRS